MKIRIILVIALLAILSAACSTETKQTDSKDADTKTEKSTEPSKNADASAALTPTDTVKAFIDAYLKKDVEAFKRVVSRKSLEGMEESAKATNATLDKQIEEFLNGDDFPFKAQPEIRNEKIDGDKATVEVKVDGKWESTPLIKEGGAWKFNFEG